jgi:hypothetical protein
VTVEDLSNDGRCAAACADPVQLIAGVRQSVFVLPPRQGTLQPQRHGVLI